MSTAGEVVAALVSGGHSIATAESLTGGLVCAELTAVPGASAVVRGAVVAYATELKARVLDVDADLLAAGGAVQAEVARQMATGVCRVVGSDLGVATTGVAGPDPQDGHPVGTVFVAAAFDGQVAVRELALSGDRASIRCQTVEHALALVLELLRGAEDSHAVNR
ncbi:nicotinamide-nucleotide amidase [Phycicoccus badiiscoriae]|uniref:Nicotinamide-nucleotide amidase n=1 Tax=Pedococcus badiiscoriae TaxID=642776 RepID=A0A852WH29_9MICO|nr:nicotinamide-nucleotide amidohydrolase family protein [Pedococcus badiiscoriae]NYG08079.1 nicotinamide-nucleotide amidase [Pedococcus badiiscoriae]